MVLKKCFAFCPLKGKTKNVLLCAALALCLLLPGCSHTKNPDISDGAEDLVQMPENTSIPAMETTGEPEVFATGFDGADGIAMDDSGNMYVGNRKTNRIYKVSTKGEVMDFVSLDCQELLCMTTDEENNLYAAGRNKVFKINPQGDTHEIGTGFSCADDVRLDGEGNLYVTDSSENRVYKITPMLEKSVFIESDQSQSELTRGWHITGISFDNTFENLYIARMLKGEVLKYPIGPDGLPGEPSIIADSLMEPDHLEVDAQGRLYVTLFREGSLIRIDPSGEIETLCDGKMGYATGIVLGRGEFGEQYAYVADYGRNQVVRINLAED
ncbi:SMP-30/gluconolactonase/LRE family protein [Lutispora saccharofermentans]|uniref:SMP-30/gluconolactonase/LRE family protein n=1 Tax=Lutispora saccharofermentans TaxID=3024236 RepID=A0ABT1NGU2_9FIRM|nr:SMP-30/gluconolactonase/LRE family protein [Lutispora saccharofermentans]MCQ1530520.1 SMP-30/gluconolactonase/LRE family protein [Lutispora saccharofermentans]